MVWCWCWELVCIVVWDGQTQEFLGVLGVWSYFIWPCWDMVYWFRGLILKVKLCWIYKRRLLEQCHHLCFYHTHKYLFRSLSMSKLKDLYFITSYIKSDILTYFSQYKNALNKHCHEYYSITLLNLSFNSLSCFCKEFFIWLILFKIPQITL